MSASRKRPLALLAAGTLITGILFSPAAAGPGVTKQFVKKYVKNQLAPLAGGLASIEDQQSTLSGALDAHKASGDHDARYATRTELGSAGAINASSNPVEWSRLKGVPADFADGEDDSGSDWDLSGNAGTNPGTQFLGTSDGRPLNFRVNNARALRLEPHGTSPNVVGGSPANAVTAGAAGASIGGGGGIGIDGPNLVTDDWGTVAGGRQNRAGDAAGATNDRPHATVGGGHDNIASGERSTVAGGAGNRATDSMAAVGGGFGNMASRQAATIAGGNANMASNIAATIAGGNGNIASSLFASIGGGTNNVASADSSTVVGGQGNIASAQHASVAGGLGNTAGGNNSIVGGGRGNRALATYATIGGGGPTILADPTTINEVTDSWSTIGGGGNNQAGDGAGTLTDRQGATVAGGQSNTASGLLSAIGGGNNNTASGAQATVGGGSSNQALGVSATVPGGSNNIAAGASSLAAGSSARANHPGSFVWADGSGGTIATTDVHQFIVRATGGVFVQTDNTLDDQLGVINTSTGAFLSAGGTWMNSSSRARKHLFSPVDPSRVLDAVKELPISTWTYREEDRGVRHLGPTAEDFQRAFGLGPDSSSIATVDADGVALAAIQGLNAELERLEAELAAGRPAAGGTSPWTVLAWALGGLGLGFGLSLGGIARRRIMPPSSSDEVRGTFFSNASPPRAVARPRRR